MNLDELYVVVTDKSSYLHSMSPDKVFMFYPILSKILAPEFRVPESDVTLILIKAVSVSYDEESDDPIFYPRQLGGDFGDSVVHAGVLGCAGSTEIRDPETGLIWPVRDIDYDQMHQLTYAQMWKPGKPVTGYLLEMALYFSKVWATTQAGFHFDAEKRITGFNSLPLEREQWKVEARKIFESTLARIQGEVYDIARGSLSTGFQDVAMSWEQHRVVCNMIKIETQGWKNISLFWLVLLPTISFLLWISSISVRKRLVITWFYLFVLKPLPKLIWSVFISTARWLWAWTIFPNGLYWIISMILKALGECT